MKRLIAATLLLAVSTSLAGVAFAQHSHGNSPIAVEETEKKKDAEAIDKQYKSALDRTKEATSASRLDPWSNMRGTDDSKAKR